jgi:ATP-binding protein involved in chromosome partitioning
MKSYSEIVGDGGSDVVGQVARQRERLEAALKGVRFIVAVGSGKGGVGKSTLTRQLGSTLIAAGRHVAILDADINGPTQARLAGMRDVPLIPGESGMALPRTSEGLGVVSLGAVVPESESLEFDSVARGDSHTWRATREFALLSEVVASVEWGPLDFLLVDLPPGADRTFQYAEFLGPETAFVLVTIPSDLARGVVLRSVAALRKTRNRLLGYIENMKGYHCADCGRVKPLFPETDLIELPIPCLGSVPFDPQLAVDCDAGVAGGGGSEPVRGALNNIADRLRLALKESP